MDTERKLAAYALAGAAAVALPSAAKASTITYVPNVDAVVNSNGSYDFNLSGISSDDITITAANTLAAISASTITGAQVQMSGGDVAALAFGTVIDPTVATGWGSGGKMVDAIAGNWPSNGTDAYLAFYFGGPSNPQAGWADIATTSNFSLSGSSSSSFEILSYAYENSPNTAITAGQTGAVPEPSSMALLAIGGAGLLALRRRRAARS